MAVFDAEDKVRQRRAKSEQAIGLAAKGRWDDAVAINREIIEIAPTDVDAHNRLGKALMELGRYAEARDAYAASVRLEPSNSIAQKNLQRLTKVAEEGGAAPSAGALDPRLFIEESGKTTVTQLTDVPRGDAAAKLAAGEQLTLEVVGTRIVVRTQAGKTIGRLEPKLEQSLLQLLQLGNKYAVFVTAASDQAVSVIIRETQRAASMGTRPSFRPSAVPEGGFRSYTREGVLRYEADDDDDEDGGDDDEAETETETGPAARDAVEETPLDTLAAAEEDEEDAEEAS